MDRASVEVVSPAQVDPPSMVAFSRSSCFSVASPHGLTEQSMFSVVKTQAHHDKAGVEGNLKLGGIIQ